MLVVWILFFGRMLIVVLFLVRSVMLFMVFF